MYQHVQQDTASFGLVGFQIAHMQQPPPTSIAPPLPPPPPAPMPTSQPSIQHSLLNCGAGVNGQLQLSHPFMHHQHQQLHHHQHQHQHQHHHHHHQFLARHHHLTNHANIMHYHHDEKRGKRTENVPSAYFPTGIIPLNARKYSSNH